jgi:glycosyltransferase involved in cell wall biosynthesis
LTKRIYVAPLLGPGGVARYAQELSRELFDPDREPHRSIALYSAPPRFASRLQRGKGRLCRYLGEQVVSPWTSRSADGIQLFDHRPMLCSSKPFVLTVHDVFFLDRPEWFPQSVQQYKRAMLALALRRRPRAIVCVSGYVRDRLVANHPEIDAARVRVISPGLTAPRKTTLPDDAGTYFLTVSVLEPKKNYETLLVAYRRAKARGLDLRWKVAGGYGYFGERIAAKLHGEPGVDLFGHADQAELERLYAGAVFVASPSVVEGFGFPALEAMRRRVPLACSSGSAYDETVGDAAVRCDPLDVAAWETALLRLAADGALRDALRDAGARRAVPYTWRRSAERHLALYDEVF